MPLESTWTIAGGYRLHARAATLPHARDRPTIVLVHGLVISSRYMVPTGKLLASDHPILAPDLPGFGRSEKPRRVLSVPELADALARWIDATGVDRPILLANSLGCQVVTELAKRYPERVRALILVGPTVDAEARSAPVQISRFLRLAWREPVSYWPIVLVDFLAAGVRRTWRTFRHMLDHRIEHALPLVRVPTLIVRGERDPIVPQRWAERAAALLPAGRLVVIPGAAHIVNYDAPEALVRACRPFVESCR